MIGIGVVGYGRWAPNLARNFAAAGARIVAVSDTCSERLAAAGAQHKSVELTTRWNDLVANPRVDALVVATPPATHFEIARAGLEAGKHLFVEKPLTLSSEHARRLVDSAAKRARILMVDHTFVYDSAIGAVHRIAAEGLLGNIVTYDSIRTGPRPRRDEVGVLWDLAVHDVAIISHIVGLFPTAVAAEAHESATSPTVCDVNLTLRFRGGLTARAQVGWSEKKIRSAVIGGTHARIAHDEFEPKGTLAAQACEDDEVNRLCSIASCDPTETLRRTADEFLDCIANGRRPLTDGEAGLRVVEVLEAADVSLTKGGTLVPVLDRAYF